MKNWYKAAMEVNHNIEYHGVEYSVKINDNTESAELIDAKITSIGDFYDFFIILRWSEINSLPSTIIQKLRDLLDVFTYTTGENIVTVVDFNGIRMYFDIPYDLAKIIIESPNEENIKKLLDTFKNGEIVDTDEFLNNLDDQTRRYVQNEAWQKHSDQRYNYIEKETDIIEKYSPMPE